MESALVGLGVYCVTLLVIVAGIVFGQMAMRPSFGMHSPLHVAKTGNALIDTLTLWDGQWYLEIAQSGYNYDPDRMSSVAFFPGYPLLITAISKPTGMPTAWAALGVSHVFLLGCFLLLPVYMREKGGGEDEIGASSTRQQGLYTLLAFGVFPPTFFLRMAYSESLFVFLSILAMYGMKRNWRPWQIAIVVGATTAVRSTGVALLIPLAIYAWCRKAAEGATGGRGDSQSFLTRFMYPAFLVLLLVPIALSGLIAYIAYQYAALSEPLAFVQAQEHWHNREDEGLGDKTASLITLEPIWGAYLPSSPAYARQSIDPAPPLINLQFANPLFFTLAAVLVGLGGWKNWLTRYEVLLAAGLLLIPYVTRAYEMCMVSQGRFAAAAFPIYIVLGSLLSRSPKAVVAAVFGLFTVYLAVYSAALAAGYVMI